MKKHEDNEEDASPEPKNKGKGKGKSSNMSKKQHVEDEENEPPKKMNEKCDEEVEKGEGSSKKNGIISDSDDD